MEAVETLEILSPGPLTSVQDLGRYGFARYGVPPSGALDSFSMRIANLLVGNSQGEAVLEITLMGLKARALTDVTLAVTGGDLGPHVNGNPMEMWKSRILRSGDILSFGRARSGCRAYVSLGGGIAADLVLGSRSTNLASRFGGCGGKALQKGQRISVHASPPAFSQTQKSMKEAWIPRYSGNQVLRVLPGPQHDDFPQDMRNLFLAASFSVTPQSDRTGIRLAGPSIRRKKGLPESILSEGIVPGAVQIPGDGQPILILVETVSGGYRKIATVITADLPHLGQLKPGDRVRFREVSQEEALEALRVLEHMIGELRGNAGAP